MERSCDLLGYHEVERHDTPLRVCISLWWWEVLGSAEVCICALVIFRLAHIYFLSLLDTIRHLPPLAHPPFVRGGGKATNK